MMTNHNPYATPESSFSSASTPSSHSRGCRRDGKFVFVPKDSDLPERCIICNAQAKSPVKTKKMHWHSPWLYLLVLCGGPLLYAIIAVFVRKKTMVSPGYCSMHLRQRRVKITAFLVSSLVLIISGIALAGTQQSGIESLMLGVGILLIIPTIAVANSFWPNRIDEYGARFKGCKEAFLSSLD